MQTLKGGRWKNQPQTFAVTDDDLLMTTDPNTDF